MYYIIYYPSVKKSRVSLARTNRITQARASDRKYRPDRKTEKDVDGKRSTFPLSESTTCSVLRQPPSHDDDDDDDELSVTDCDKLEHDEPYDNRNVCISDLVIRSVRLIV